MKKEESNSQKINLSNAVVAVLQQIPSNSGKSEDLYPLIATAAGITNEHPIMKQIYRDGRSAFELRVQAAVEHLRRKKIIVRGGKRGIWKLKK